MKNRKCFFIWANESWTKNAAFGTTTDTIETNYSNKENFGKIYENLKNYFKNDSYLKIDNKPVLSIHHPWFIENEELDNFYNLINTKCIENNFNGIYFIVNAINEKYNQYINNYHHLNYKKSINSKYYDKNNNNNVLDYKKYIKNDININNDGIHTIVFDFDNCARLFKPNKLNNSTITINNTEIEKIIFMKKIIEKYKNNKIENILLINSWNEWGEKMAIEPSEEIGYYYLNLLTENLENKNKENNQ
jgi:hypothetical protein